MIEYIYIIALHLLGSRVFLAMLPDDEPIFNRIFVVVFWPIVAAWDLLEQIFR